MTAPSGGSSSAEASDRRALLQELTTRVQHQLNNPLAALLAEGQLLAMEPALDPAHREAVERMIELVRRVIGMVRQLDDGPV